MAIVKNAPPEKPNTIHANPAYQGLLFGVELEIEAEGLYDIEEEFDEDGDPICQRDPTLPSGWLREQEDSIRGVEVISDRPYDFNTTVKNIYRLFEDVDRQGYNPMRTPRGSTHVHVNVCDLTWEQMRSFIMACIWAEPFLVELAGKGRKGNLFAQSYETTPLGWRPIIDWYRNRQIMPCMDIHYMATSFQPMGYLGSVEFRMGPSSRNAKEALSWLQHIADVADVGRNATITNEQPRFILNWMDQLPPGVWKRLATKASRYAQEVWECLHEPVPPQPALRRAKKSAAITGLAATINTLEAAANSPAPTPSWHQYEVSVSPYTEPTEEQLNQFMEEMTTLASVPGASFATPSDEPEPTADASTMTWYHWTPTTNQF